MGRMTKADLSKLKSDSLEILKGYLRSGQTIYWLKTSQSRTGTSGSYRFFVIHREYIDGKVESEHITDLTYHIGCAVGILPTESNTLRVTGTGFNKPLSVVEKLICAIRVQKWDHLPLDVIFRCAEIA